MAHPFDAYIDSRPEHEWRIAEAALLFARDHDPAMRPEQWLRELDGLAQRVDARGAATPGERVEALRHVLVDLHGLDGNRSDYYDPGNSLLHRVLETRRGIPITLSVVWMDVAGLLGWPVVGLAIPGHFMVAYDDPAVDIVVDPYNSGARMARGDVLGHLMAAAGIHPVVGDEHFLPAEPSEVLQRMLNNLNLVYLQRQEWPRAARTIARLMALAPGDAMLARQADAVAQRMAALN